MSVAVIDQKKVIEAFSGLFTIQTSTSGMIRFLKDYSVVGEKIVNFTVDETLELFQSFAIRCMKSNLESYYKKYGGEYCFEYEGYNVRFLEKIDEYQVLKTLESLEYNIEVSEEIEVRLSNMIFILMQCIIHNRHEYKKAFWG